MFCSLLERPLVAENSHERYARIVSMFDQDLDSCKSLYDEHIRSTEQQGELNTRVCPKKYGF